MPNAVQRALIKGGEASRALYRPMADFRGMRVRKLDPAELVKLHKNIDYRAEVKRMQEEMVARWGIDPLIGLELEFAVLRDGKRVLISEEDLQEISTELQQRVTGVEEVLTENPNSRRAELYYELAISNNETLRIEEFMQNLSGLRSELEEVVRAKLGDDVVVDYKVSDPKWTFLSKVIHVNSSIWQDSENLLRHKNIRKVLMASMLKSQVENFHEYINDEDDLKRLENGDGAPTLLEAKNARPLTAFVNTPFIMAWAGALGTAIYEHFDPRVWQDGFRDALLTTGVLSLPWFKPLSHLTWTSFPSLAMRGPKIFKNNNQNKLRIEDRLPSATMDLQKAVYLNLKAIYDACCENFEIVSADRYREKAYSYYALENGSVLQVKKPQKRMKRHLFPEKV